MTQAGSRLTVHQWITEAMRPTPTTSKSAYWVASIPVGTSGDSPPTTRLSEKGFSCFFRRLPPPFFAGKRGANKKKIVLFPPPPPHLPTPPPPPPFTANLKTVAGCLGGLASTIAFKHRTVDHEPTVEEFFADLRPRACTSRHSQISESRSAQRFGPPAVVNRKKKKSKKQNQKTITFNQKLPDLLSGIPDQFPSFFFFFFFFSPPPPPPPPPPDLWVAVTQQGRQAGYGSHV